MRKNGPKIIKVNDLLISGSLKIPNYQRPYKWTTKNVNQLIDDILNYKEKSEYPLGVVVVRNHDHTSKTYVEGIEFTVMRDQNRIINNAYVNGKK